MVPRNLLAITLLFCCHAVLGQQNPAASMTSAQTTQTQAVPAHAASFQAATPAAPVISVQQKNPVTPTPVSIARAKAIYGFDCASCHGETGNGQGDLARDLKLVMPDFTDPATLKDKLDAELFDAIHNGKGKMESEGDRANTNETWNLVLYCRSFAKKSAPTVPAPATLAPATPTPATPVPAAK